MPRTTLPPTPASSTDIKSQDGAAQLASLQTAFELPPPALAPLESKRKLSPPEDQTPPKSPYPLQPSEIVKSRRRSSAAQPPKDQFALPPPPTRSRKIIQMKPKAQEGAAASPANSTKSQTTAKNAAGASSVSAPLLASGTKRKQPSATSAAGRKIARKTAHSLIERRRRSKMNEEFAVLKGMIPACTGEMHKLAILQASIEYVRYLEDCISKLKSQHGIDPEGNSSKQAPAPQFSSFQTTSRFGGEESPDVEMTGSETPSPTFSALHSRSQEASVSPALLAQDTLTRHGSQSSIALDQRRYSYNVSADTSPILGPQTYGYAQSVASASGSAITSPALAPQRDMDQEATAALLMLTQTDRRGTGGSNGRGMSVRELLTT